MSGKRVESRRMHKLRDEFFELGKRQSAEGRADEAQCWLCRTDIDYTAAPGTTADSHTLDHYFDVDTHPELQEDPDNFRHAHYSCNSSRGKRAPNTQDLGEQVAAWW